MQSVGTWLSTLVALAGFLFALLAWRKERSDNTARDLAKAEQERRERASSVNAWPQKGSDSLVTLAHQSTRNKWVIVVQNNTDVPIFTWSYATYVDPPGQHVSLTSDIWGPIPPYAQPLIFPLDNVSYRDAPRFEGQFEYQAPDGCTWRRQGSSSLEETSQLSVT